MKPHKNVTDPNIVFKGIVRIAMMNKRHRNYLFCALLQHCLALLFKILFLFYYLGNPSFFLLSISCSLINQKSHKIKLNRVEYYLPSSLQMIYGLVILVFGMSQIVFDYKCWCKTCACYGWSIEN